jgi:hypothetical protein
MFFVTAEKGQFQLAGSVSNSRDFSVDGSKGRGRDCYVIKDFFAQRQ